MTHENARQGVTEPADRKFSCPSFGSSCIVTPGWVPLSPKQRAGPGPAATGFNSLELKGALATYSGFVIFACTPNVQVEHISEGQQALPQASTRSPGSHSCNPQGRLLPQFQPTLELNLSVLLLPLCPTSLQASATNLNFLSVNHSFLQSLKDQSFAA